MGRIVTELRKVELLRQEGRAMRLRGRKSVVREETVCPYCHKRLGQSVVAVIPEYSPPPHPPFLGFCVLFRGGD